MAGLLPERVIETFLEEDDHFRNLFYRTHLPSDPCRCFLKIKDDLILSGLPFFFSVFDYLGYSVDASLFEKYEGRQFFKKDERVLEFELPFNHALCGERLALNILTRCSSIATTTSLFVEKAKGSGIKILDTRKTLPGFRSLDKYAVRTGGGFNHRFSQNDVWMIKDNHKKFFGGLEEAVSFFRGMGAFYQSIIAEIHSLEEFEQALKLDLAYVMLDNFSQEDIKTAVAMKKKTMTIEISGGVNLENIENYLIQGVDAISIGALTNHPKGVDLSLKMERKSE